MDKNIPLHPERGLDPRLTYCTRCLCETPEIVVGHNRKMIHKETGQIAFAPKNQVSNVAKKIGWTHQYRSEEIPEGERLPASDLCDSCKEELTEWKEVVAAGGVYLRCPKCGLEAVLKTSDAAKALRESANAGPTDPCGIEFESCRQHIDMGVGTSE